VTKDKSGRGVSIKPQKLDLKLRRGVPFEIEVTLLPEDQPLDLYYLMDLTKTMEDDKVIKAYYPLIKIILEKAYNYRLCVGFRNFYHNWEMNWGTDCRI
jgi:hypothetical protein